MAKRRSEKTVSPPSRSLWRRIFCSAPSGHSKNAVSFEARVHRFRLFLSAHIEAYSEMMAFEERLASELPVGMPFLRLCTARLTIATMECLGHLNALGDNGYSRLEAPFAALRANLRAALDQGTWPLEGPLVIDNRELGPEHGRLVCPALTKYAAVRAVRPDYVPRGFVVTGAAWWRYFSNPEMHDEIDRLMLISQEDPASYNQAGVTIREYITRSFPLPEDLEAALDERLEELFSDNGLEEQVLLVRCFSVRPEFAALILPEQILHPPFSREAVSGALRSALAMTYRTRAMIYRLKLGVRDRGMPFCVSFTLLPLRQARGSAHAPLDRPGADSVVLHIRRGLTRLAPGTDQRAVEGAVLPAPLRVQVEKHCAVCLKALASGPVTGSRHEIFWTVSRTGAFFILAVNALPDPRPESPDPAQGDARASAHALPALEGGLSTFPGTAAGTAMVVRNIKDALAFPAGALLLVHQAAPRWSFLLDFARGAVAGDGTGNGPFALVARCYGRPTVLHLPEALESCTTGDMLEIVSRACAPSQVMRVERAGTDGVPQITGGRARFSCSSEACSGPGDAPGNRREPPNVPEGEACELFERTEHSKAVGHLWLPHGDIARIARDVAPRIVPLSFADTDSPDFRAENCATFHDFLVYCHHHAVKEIFRHSTSRKTASVPAKQLVCDVPKQFWVVNLDDGFYENISGPNVRLEEIASLPMRSFWRGFAAKPWEGPPQLNARGFLSVLFEATANPHLDPASQSTQYTEKNTFLIARRFCSMRCRFGFHFLSLDCLLRKRQGERFIIFQFKGGAANLARRVKRVRFVAELLSRFDFASEIIGDTLTARLEQGSEEEFGRALCVIGYLVMHTRQLDMIMDDDAALAAHRLTMLEDMRALAALPPLDLPPPRAPRSPRSGL